MCRIRLVHDDPRVFPIAKLVARRDAIPGLVAEVNQALNGGAYLFSFDAGFFILQPYVNEQRQRVVNVLLAHAKGGNGVKTYLPAVLQLARSIQADKVTALTGDKRVKIVMTRAGFQCVGNDDNGLYLMEILFSS